MLAIILVVIVSTPAGIFLIVMGIKDGIVSLPEHDDPCE